jgi:predicted hotdog family 3-hydroxylacyl-ACP dehydratase
VLDREAIALRIPHAGRMVLLDRVIEWDARAIRCATRTHLDPANPLRDAAGLPVWAGIEYGAQAAAIHGALLNGDASPRRGVLATAREVEALCERLDEVEGELVVAATLAHADPAGAIYAFEASSAGRVLLAGRTTLMYLKAGA